MTSCGFAPRVSGADGAWPNEMVLRCVTRNWTGLALEASAPDGAEKEGPGTGELWLAASPPACLWPWPACSASAGRLALGSAASAADSPSISDVAVPPTAALASARVLRVRFADAPGVGAPTVEGGCVSSPGAGRACWVNDPEGSNAVADSELAVSIDTLTGSPGMPSERAAEAAGAAPLAPGSVVAAACSAAAAETGSLGGKPTSTTG
mmetsp:Transcript_14711/g.55445  ORF Transcript_14711/g.55445 Transcript_14711/m.55445 type:complete len:209 (-) Transcript_14711:997-1623(-)